MITSKPFLSYIRDAGAGKPLAILTHSIMIVAPVLPYYATFFMNIHRAGEYGTILTERFLKYTTAYSIGGFFTDAIFKFKDKLQDPEFLAKEQANFIAEHTVYALEMGASVFAFSYGILAHTTCTNILLSDFRFGGDNSSLSTLESGLSDVICASGLVGNCVDIQDVQALAADVTCASHLVGSCADIQDVQAN